VTHAAAPAAFLGVPRVPHVPYTPKCLPPGIFQDQVQITYGTELASAGIDLLALRELMGHANPETTAAYVNPRELHQTGEFALVA